MTNLNTRRHTYVWEGIDSWKFDEGLSYKQIRDRHFELYGYAPSKGTLSTRYGKGVDDKRKQRRAKQINNNDPMYRIGRKVDTFKRKIKSKHNKIDDTLLMSPWNRFRSKIKNFKRKGNGYKVNIKDNYTTQDVIDRFWPNGISKCGNKFPYIQCYITGDIVDVTNTTTHLDHVDPIGGNEISNMAFTTKYANQMKSDQTIDELLEMCNKIINHLRG
jgi:hypothetical protein